MADPMKVAAFDLMQETGWAGKVCYFAVVECGGHAELAKLCLASLAQRAKMDLTMKQEPYPRRDDIREWVQGFQSGRESARERAEKRELGQLTIGLVEGVIETCPKCMIRHPSSDAEQGRCPHCRTSMIALGSLGCIISPGVCGEMEGFNGVMESHIRKRVNPKFRWDLVFDAS